MLNTERLKIDRAQFIDELKNRQIGTSVHFIPLHLQPYFANKYNYKKGDFPVTEKIYDKIISIPIYPRLTKDQIYYIIFTIRNLVQEFRIKSIT